MGAQTGGGGPLDRRKGKGFRVCKCRHASCRSNAGSLLCNREVRKVVPMMVHCETLSTATDVKQKKKEGRKDGFGSKHLPLAPSRVVLSASGSSSSSPGATAIATTTHNQLGTPTFPLVSIFSGRSNNVVEEGTPLPSHPINPTLPYPTLLYPTLPYPTQPSPAQPSPPSFLSRTRRPRSTQKEVASAWPLHLLPIQRLRAPQAMMQRRPTTCPRPVVAPKTTTTRGRRGP